MKRVLLLGATGMLGGAIYSVLHKKYDLILGVRNAEKVKLLRKTYGGMVFDTVPFDAQLLHHDYATWRGHRSEYLKAFLEKVGQVDHVINALGITIPFSLRDPALTYFINGAFPHILARIFEEKLIHITTDCVYSGKEDFPYDEVSPKSPNDLYGLSKSLGEPANCLTIRTSIIGRELSGFTGLLEWFLQQEGKTLTGFSEHYWNGITARQFGKICAQILETPDSFPRHGVFHVFSSVVSKYEMLLAFQKKYKLPCTINADHENKLNRTLSTVKVLNELLRVPSFVEMLDELQ